MRKIKICVVFFLIFIIMLSGCFKSLGEKDTNNEQLSEIPEAYVGLLEEYHQFVLRFDDSEESNNNFDDSKLAISEMLLIMQPQEILKKIGYAVTDINNDNLPELVIGEVNVEAQSLEMGGIYALFTIKEDTPYLILTGNARDKYFYLGDGEFVNQSTNAAGDYYLSLFKLNKGEIRLEPKGLYISQMQESSNVEEKYYYSKSNEYDLKHAQKLKKEEFDKAIEKIRERVVKVEYTPFSKYQAEQDSQQSECTQKTEQVSKQNQKNQKDSKEDPLAFQTMKNLKQCLVGEWIYQDSVSMEDSAWITVSKDGSYQFKIIHPEHMGEYKSEGKIEILDILKDENGVGNVISLKSSSFTVPEEKKNMYFGVSFDGDYALNYKTLGDGEVIIELFQISNGMTFMSDIFGSSVHVFRKESDWMQHSKVQKSSEFYAICSKKDYENGVMWLDDVDYNKETYYSTNSHPFEAIAYQTAELEAKNPVAKVEYLCDLLYVITDAEGKVISYQEVKHVNSPF